MTTLSDIFNSALKSEDEILDAAMAPLGDSRPSAGARLIPGGQTHMKRPTSMLESATSAVGEFFAGDGDWERATVLPRAVNPKTGERSWAVPALISDPVRGVWGMMKAPHEIQRALDTSATEAVPSPLGVAQDNLAVDTFNAGLGQTGVQIARAGKAVLQPSSTASIFAGGNANVKSPALSQANANEAFDYYLKDWTSVDSDVINAVRQAQAQRDGLENAWFMGPDGKWRFEIDDSKSKVDPTDLRELRDKGYVDSGFGAMVDHTSLLEIMSHPALFEAYPELQDVKVKLDAKGSTLGYFDSQNNVLGLNPDHYKKAIDGDPVALEDLKGTILHEAQHWVQSKEGFTRGSNQTLHVPIQPIKERQKFSSDTGHLGYKNAAEELMQTPSVMEAFEDIILQHNYLTPSGMPKDDPGFTARYYIQLIESLVDPKKQKGDTHEVGLIRMSDENLTWDRDGVDGRNVGVSTADRDAILGDLLYDERTAAVIDLLSKQRQHSRGMERAFDVYKKVGGEVEARDVTNRMNLTAEERITTAPYSSEPYHVQSWYPSPLDGDATFTNDVTPLGGRMDAVVRRPDDAPRGVPSTDGYSSVFPAPQRFLDPNDKAYKPGLGEPTKGGKYLEMPSKTDITGQLRQSGSISVGPDGKPSFKVSPESMEEPVFKGGSQVKTNLFKQKAGWSWVNAPEGFENANTIVSVETGGKHFYTLRTDFENGVGMARYPDSKSEPRLRPTVKGDVELGQQIGTIKIRDKEHPVYDTVYVFRPNDPNSGKGVDALEYLRNAGAK